MTLCLHLVELVGSLSVLSVCLDLLYMKSELRQLLL